MSLVAQILASAAVLASSPTAESKGDVVTCYGAMASVAQANPADKKAANIAFATMLSIVEALGKSDRAPSTWADMFADARMASAGRYPNYGAARVHCDQSVPGFLPPE